MNAKAQLVRDVCVEINVMKVKKLTVKDNCPICLVSLFHRTTLLRGMPAPPKPSKKVNTDEANNDPQLDVQVDPSNFRGDNNVRR